MHQWDPSWHSSYRPSNHGLSANTSASLPGLIGNWHQSRNVCSKGNRYINDNNLKYLERPFQARRKHVTMILGHLPIFHRHWRVYISIYIYNQLPLNISGSRLKLLTSRSKAACKLLPEEYPSLNTYMELGSGKWLNNWKCTGARIRFKGVQWIDFWWVPVGPKTAALGGTFLLLCALSLWSSLEPHPTWTTSYLDRTWTIHADLLRWLEM